MSWRLVPERFVAEWLDPRVGGAGQPNISFMRRRAATSRTLDAGPQRAQIQYLRALRYTKYPGTNEVGMITSRAGWWKATLQRGWDEALPGPSGGRLCPGCGTEVRVSPSSSLPRDWHLDHVKPWTKRMFSAAASRKTVIRDYQSGVNLLCPRCNLSKGNRG